MHFIIGRDQGKTPTPPQEELESAVADLVRTWPDNVRDAIKARFDPMSARHLSERYALAFHGGYKEVYTAETALLDLLKIEALSKDRETAVTFYETSAVKDDLLTLKVYHLWKPIPLSARVPLLGKHGL